MMDTASKRPLQTVHCSTNGAPDPAIKGSAGSAIRAILSKHVRWRIGAGFLSYMIYTIVNIIYGSDSQGATITRAITSFCILAVSSSYYANMNIVALRMLVWRPQYALKRMHAFSDCMFTACCQSALFLGFCHPFRGTVCGRDPGQDRAGFSTHDRSQWV